MKYDDASWHHGGDFPADLPQEAGGTHIAMFVVWCWAKGMAGALTRDEFPEILQAVSSRSDSPGAIFARGSDDKFTDEDLNDEGNAFASAYYGVGGELRDYVRDYESTLGRGLPSVYHVSDTWEVFDRLEPVIARRFKAWRGKRTNWFEKLWPWTKQ